LEACGQAPWLDYLKRSLIHGGDLQKMIEVDGVKGVTSNPSIFEKAIGGSNEYDGDIKAFLAKRDSGVSDIYEHLVFADIQAAADVLRGVYDATDGRDGYVSLECSPYLANDTEATVKEAQHLWQSVGRPNLMVKVPGTPAGIPAIRRLIGAGININVTLLFAISAYEEVVEAYIGGLEDLQKAGGDVSRIGSVASFFVSRIDTAVDKALDAKPDAPKDLKGKAAIANAKLAYARYKDLFAGPRWDALAKAGAKTQRLLWASTSTKSKDMKDTIYVEAMIGKDTVDTIPPATLDAFRDHGVVKADAIEDDLDEAKAVLAAVAKAGVSLDEITTALVVDGVQQFADAFDKLFAAIAAQRRKDLDEPGQLADIRAGSDQAQAAFDAEMEQWRKTGAIRRLWAGDKALWTGADEDQWTGWLRIVDDELAQVADLQAFAKAVKAQSFTDVVLLGMGGSSLGPEVIAKTFGDHAGWPRFHMLDSTDPNQIKALEDDLQIEHTLFITSSKSGGTLEPNIFTDYFYDLVTKACGADEAPKRFVAVTDPGSSLDKRAEPWMKTFHGTPSIGGRYSVLSDFGLVPAAAMGLDVERLLKTTATMVRACGPDAPPAENPGVQLGVVLGVAAAQLGRDKVTIIASPGLEAIGAWLEQLLAESTGKLGKGLIPVADEPLGSASAYGSDRVFAYVELQGAPEPKQAALMDDLVAAGHPVVKIVVKDIWRLGQEFFRWEVAVAVAGSILGIDPFDQPDVEASKIKTKALTEQYEKDQSLPPETPVFTHDGVALYADPRNAQALGRHNTLDGYLRSHFDQLKTGDYAAFLAYIERSPTHVEAMSEIRGFVRDRTKAATCVGFGPRFQHSTGQAYKGGPNSGVFLQVTCDDPHDLAVPGHHYSFGVVKAAQARGDLEVLVERDRRALRIHLKDVDAGLSELTRAVHDALADRG
jgi:transaldolase/glucose-6-phosphate isomerase